MIEKALGRPIRVPAEVVAPFLARGVTAVRMSRPILYDYWRSSAGYRSGSRLNLKGVDYESPQVDLRGRRSRNRRVIGHSIRRG